MGVYCGPFIKILNPTKEVSHTETFKCCVNESCKNYNKEYKNKFCPECGKEIGTSERIIIKRKTFYANDFCDEHFDNPDMFNDTGEYIEDKYVIENRFSRYLDHGEVVEEFETFDSCISKDWKKLMNKLSEVGYEYETGYGVIVL